MTQGLGTERMPEVFADFPVDLPQEVKKIRREARAAGLSESEVEKISTCPLVKLLVNQS